jgi:hypothetical protein
MKMFPKIITGAIGMAAALGLSAQAQNLLVNGSFESPTGFTGNPITLATVNQGWATFNGASSAGTSIVAAQDGTTSFLETALVGNNWNPAGAYQIVSITPGQTYNLSLWAMTDTANDAYAATSGLLYQMTWADSTLTSLGTPINPDPALPGPINTWVHYTGTATAPATAAYAEVYLMFQDNGSTAATEDLYYDNVSLTAQVPEPATIALLGMGLAFPLYLIRRRK